MQSSTGHDKISIEIIKLFGEHILKPTEHIINNVIDTCEVPDIFKLSIIHPIFIKEIQII